MQYKQTDELLRATLKQKTQSQKDYEKAAQTVLQLAAAAISAC